MQDAEAFHGVAVVDEVSYDLFYHRQVLLKRDHMLADERNVFEVFIVVDPELAGEVELRHLADGLKELVGGAAELWLEEGHPEDPGLPCLQFVQNIILQVVVHHVFEVDLVELVGPRVEHLEAFVIHLLPPVSLNIVLEKLKICRISLDRIAQIIWNDLFLVVAKIGTQDSDA